MLEGITIILEEKRYINAVLMIAEYTERVILTTDNIHGTEVNMTITCIRIILAEGREIIPVMVIAQYTNIVTQKQDKNPIIVKKMMPPTLHPIFIIVIIFC